MVNKDVYLEMAVLRIQNFHNACTVHHLHAAATEINASIAMITTLSACTGLFLSVADRGSVVTEIIIKNNNYRYIAFRTLFTCLFIYLFDFCAKNKLFFFFFLEFTQPLLQLCWQLPFEHYQSTAAL